MTPLPTSPGTPAEAEEVHARRVAALISGLLRWGVRASFLLIVVGSIVSFARRSHGAADADLAQLTGAEGAFPRRLGWVVNGVAALEGVPLIVAGLLLLIATPVLRVLVTVAIFAGQRDRVFVVITAGVLVLLTLAFILGRVSG